MQKEFFRGTKTAKNFEIKREVNSLNIECLLDGRGNKGSAIQ